MAYIVYNKHKLIENARIINRLCAANKLEFVAVTKCIRSYPPLLRLLAGQGITSFAESNLKAVADFTSTAPEEQPDSGLSEDSSKRQVTPYFSLLKTNVSDVAALPGAFPIRRIFVSNTAVLQHLQRLPAESCPQIMLIAEIGDLRDGFTQEQFKKVLRQYKKLPLAGVSGNFACLEGFKPAIAQLEILSRYGNLLEQTKGTPACISGGGTVLWDMLECGVLAERLSEIRMGEALFLGWNSRFGIPIPELYQDVWTFYGEILETSYKQIGGVRTLRTVLDFGKLAAPIRNLAQVNPEIRLCGQTFDYTVIDLSGLNRRHYSAFIPGKSVPFSVDYHILSQAMLNPFITVYGYCDD